MGGVRGVGKQPVSESDGAEMGGMGEKWGAAKGKGEGGPAAAAAAAASGRVCWYTGGLFCSECHCGDVHSIPGLVLHKWDLQVR